MNIIEREFLRIRKRLSLLNRKERQEVSDFIGKSESTLKKISDGRSSNPQLDTLVALHDYFFNEQLSEQEVFSHRHEHNQINDKSVEHEAA